MIINHNMNAMNAHRNMGMNNVSAGKSMEKLSSGLRINRAGDDAAGLSISEKMRSQIRGLDQGARNAQDGISMIQTAEGGLNETHSILQRMRELGVQAANDTNNDSDRDAINDELGQLKTEIDRISNTTAFNGKQLLNGSLSVGQDTVASTVKVGAAFDTTTVVTKVDVSGAAAGKQYDITYTAASDTLTITDSADATKTQSLILTAQVPADGAETTWNFDDLGIKITVAGAPTTNLDALGTDLNGENITTNGNGSANLLIGSNGGSNETLSVNFRKMDSSVLGTQNGGSTALDDALSTYSTTKNKTNAEALVSAIDESIKDVSKQRSILGASQNRLEHTIANLQTSSENLTSAESRIRDVDMAKEMMNFSKNNILSQAAQAMLAQANQQPQGVLQLLR
jgi:flagellin